MQHLKTPCCCYLHQPSIACHQDWSHRFLRSIPPCHQLLPHTFQTPQQSMPFHHSNFRSQAAFRLWSTSDPYTCSRRSMSACLFQISWYLQHQMQHLKIPYCCYLHQPSIACHQDWSHRFLRSIPPCHQLLPHTFQTPQQSMPFHHSNFRSQAAFRLWSTSDPYTCSRRSMSACLFQISWYLLIQIKHHESLNQ